MSYSRLQLALPFPHEPSFDARDFLTAASNQDALTWLERWRDWPDRRLALWGQAGCGKTHLLHIWAARHDATRLIGQALRGLEEGSPADGGLDERSREALPASGAVVVDDADTVSPDTTLLHLLNTARDRGLFVLLAGRTAPAHWPLRLPDLTSRLRAVTAVEIRPPDDDLLRTLLVRLLADRQLTMSRHLQDWLLLRLPRSPAALRQAVARLDRASLAFGKAITRPLASQLLAGEEGAMASERDTDDAGVPVSTPMAAPQSLSLL